MSDNIHPVVKLLAARMESNPEEFEFFPKNNETIGRWSEWIHRLTPVMNDAEKELLLGKFRQEVLGVIHEEVMKEMVEAPRLRSKTFSKEDLELMLADLNKSFREEYEKEKTK